MKTESEADIQACVTCPRMYCDDGSRDCHFVIQERLKRKAAKAARETEQIKASIIEILLALKADVDKEKAKRAKKKLREINALRSKLSREKQNA